MTCLSYLGVREAIPEMRIGFLSSQEIWIFLEWLQTKKAQGFNSLGFVEIGRVGPYRK